MIDLMRDRGLRWTLIRLAPLLLLLAGCSGCEDPPPNYGDEHQDATGPSIHWPTTGKIVQGFFGTDTANPDPGPWMDRDGQRQYFEGGHNFHRGVDIENAHGTRVYAAADGLAYLYAWDGHSISGNVIVIRAVNGSITTYCHLDRFAIAQGDKVTANTVIGYMGSTGNQARPHLHFAMQFQEGSELWPKWTPGEVGQMVTSGAELR